MMSTITVIDMEKIETMLSDQKLQLTHQEKACLTELIMGKSTNDIAEKLKLPPHKIQSYTTRILQTFECFSREQLIAKTV